TPAARATRGGVPADAVARVAHALAWALVQFVWQGVVLWLALLVARAVTRTASARARYACACATLAAMALAPAVTATRLLRTGDAGAPIAAATTALAPASTPVASAERAVEERAGAASASLAAPP